MKLMIKVIKLASAFCLIALVILICIVFWIVGALPDDLCQWQDERDL